MIMQRRRFLQLLGIAPGVAVVPSKGAEKELTIASDGWVSCPGTVSPTSKLHINASTDLVNLRKALGNVFPRDALSVIPTDYTWVVRMLEHDPQQSET